MHRHKTHTSKKANRHEEMKSTVDTVRGQEAKNTSSTQESCSNLAHSLLCMHVSVETV